MLKDEKLAKRIATLVGNIPRGKVCTYGAIAAAAGKFRGGRQVGYALSHGYAKGTPTHRMVNHRGALAPEYAFGRGIQRQMLEEEGVTFLPNGCVDMKKHFFQPTEKIEK
jgi:Predicted methylated DNA-protein cysteine methyltransferase